MQSRTKSAISRDAAAKSEGSAVLPTLLMPYLAEQARQLPGAVLPYVPNAALPHDLARQVRNSEEEILRRNMERDALL